MPTGRSQQLHEWIDVHELKDGFTARLAELNWSIYRLAERSNLSFSASHVYRYLRGERELSAPFLGEVFKVLGLEMKTTIKAKPLDKDG